VTHFYSIAKLPYNSPLSGGRAFVQHKTKDFVRLSDTLTRGRSFTLAFSALVEIQIEGEEFHTTLGG
jgi:hypothetical protein